MSELEGTVDILILTLRRLGQADAGAPGHPQQQIRTKDEERITLRMCITCVSIQTEAEKSMGQISNTG